MSIALAQITVNPYMVMHTHTGTHTRVNVNAFLTWRSRPSE